MFGWAFEGSSVGAAFCSGTASTVSLCEWSPAGERILTCERPAGATCKNRSRQRWALACDGAACGSTCAENGGRLSDLSRASETVRQRVEVNDHRCENHLLLSLTSVSIPASMTGCYTDFLIRTVLSMFEDLCLVHFSVESMRLCDSSNVEQPLRTRCV